ncbi:MAG TPA: hypothetical protein DC064_17195 [Cyanobacteria bacterium UBA9273]|nr:hypothetical protein [Cyanobacteria bacterium UBA9273]
MLRKINFKFLYTTVLSLVLINSIEIPQPRGGYWGIQLNTSTEALARSSGGRSGGGSFRSSPSNSSSGSSSRSSTGSSSSFTKPSSSSGSSSSYSRPSTSSSSSKPASSPSAGASSSPAIRDSSTSTKPASPVNAPSSRTSGGRAGGGTLTQPASPTSPIRSATTTNPKQTQPRSPIKTHSVTPPRHIDIDIEIEDDDDDFNPPQTAPNSATTGSTAPVAPAQVVPNSATPGSTTTTPVPPASTSATESNNSQNSENSVPVWLVVLVFVVAGVATFLVVYFILKQIKASSAARERDNDTVTVSKLQIALLAGTPGLQSELSQLTLNVDTETREGLLELLQESALVLLRNTDTWSHVLASSESIHIDKAEALFNQISVQERSKFSAETLSNIRGKVKQKAAVTFGVKEDLGSYIVVTLLVGTADDKPLFKEVRSLEALKEALEKVASVRSDYLMKVELLWSPQEEGESLTYDELLTEYTNMVQIV